MPGSGDISATNTSSCSITDTSITSLSPLSLSVGESDLNKAIDNEKEQFLNKHQENNTLKAA